MAYTVFARKYRPQTFDALIGQEHVARTLAGAIEADRVAHAFLFTGVRGVGKTSTARLLAKALNCEKGPTPTPCNVCDMCRDITAGVDMDVQEMDGASHNGVDDVRRLQESLPFRPARDRFKIVIVDEVHMLSTGAFNAFLKTLEEPPEHVKFIFATTESHKVPVTIRSRCQRYDFRLIPQAKVAASIRSVLKAEGIEADEAAVRVVAREAAGSMRDALTLLDQLVAFSGGTLNGDSVSEQLGIAAREAVHEVTRGLIEGDAPAVLVAVDAVMERSADPLHFSQQLLQYMRDAVVLRLAGAQTEQVDFVDEERDALFGLVNNREPLELERAFAALAKLVDEIAAASMPGLVLEMGLTRIATRPALMGVVELVRRLEALEQRLGPGGGGGRRRPPGGGGGGLRPDATQRSATSHAEQSSAPRSSNVSRDSAPATTAPVTTASAAPASMAPASAAPVPTAPAPAPTAAPAPATTEPPSTPRTSAAPGSTPARSAAHAATHGPADNNVSDPPSASAETRQPSPPSSMPSEERKSAPQPAPAASSTAPAPPSGAPLRRAALQEWEGFIETLRESRPALAAVLEHGVPRVVSAERIVLSFQKNSFYGRQADAPAAREAIQQTAQERMGSAPAIEVRYDLEAAENTHSVAALEATRRDAKQKQRRREALGHPVVRDAIQVFSGSTGRVSVQLEGE